MMPNPEDAFDDENAPPIPQLGDSGADISDEAREKAAQEAEEERACESGAEPVARGRRRGDCDGDDEQARRKFLREVL